MNEHKIYVSPNGDDSGPGTNEKPFLTLDRARDELRNRKRSIDEPGVVILEAGAYTLSGTFELDGRDSNVEFRAAEGAEVRVTGGLEVPLDQLTPVTDKAVLDRLPESTRGDVVKLSLPGKGPGDSSTWPMRFRGYADWPEVYANGNPLRLARWPNKGYAKIEEVLDPGSRPRLEEEPDKGGRFTYAEERPAAWRHDQPIYLGGYWCNKWYDEYIRVQSIDTERKEIQMAAPHHYGIGGRSEGLFFAINLLEELNQPGEYVFDGTRNELYLLLPENAKDSIQVAIQKEPLVRVDRGTDLRFKGMTFENGCGNAIEIGNCDSVVFSNCHLRQISGTGVTIDGGKACGVEHSRLEIIGKAGVTLQGGDRLTLTPSGHFVTQCHISHFARLVQTYCPAVEMKGVGQVCRSNYVHDAPHTAILFHGNDHEIELNHIERVCQDTSDAGAIYVGRSWRLGGNRIVGNFIRELGHAAHDRNWGIYLDDFASGLEVSRNVIMDTDSGILVGGGRYNVVTDNVLINCPNQSIYVDGRGMNWGKESIHKRDGTMWKRLYEVPLDSGVWHERFPYLAEVEHDGFAEPRHNTVTGNMLNHSRPMRMHHLVLTHGTVEKNMTVDTLGPSEHVREDERYVG